MPGTPELLVILGVIVLLFGGAKLPGLARSLGQAKGEFAKGVAEGGKEKDASTPAPPADKT